MAARNFGEGSPSGLVSGWRGGGPKRARAYAPDLCSAQTLAYRLDCSVSTVHAYVRRKLLPEPVKLGDLMRWRWADVERLTDDLANGRNSRGTEADPYLDGIERGTTEEAGD